MHLVLLNFSQFYTLLVHFIYSLFSKCFLMMISLNCQRPGYSMSCDYLPLMTIVFFVAIGEAGKMTFTESDHIFCGCSWIFLLIRYNHKLTLIVLNTLTLRLSCIFLLNAVGYTLKTPSLFQNWLRLEPLLQYWELLRAFFERIKEQLNLTSNRLKDYHIESFHDAKVSRLEWFFPLNVYVQAPFRSQASSYKCKPNCYEE